MFMVPFIIFLMGVTEIRFNTQPPKYHCYEYCKTKVLYAPKDLEK